MSKKGHIPERTCVVCRKKCCKYELIRFCVKGDKVIIDDTHTAGGRGAYTCPSCIFQLKKKKFLKKLLHALRVEGIKEVELPNV